MTPPEIEPVDVVALTRDLIRCPSVTPEDAGALPLLSGVLEGLGFRCQQLRFEAPDTAPVSNLYARIGDAAPVFAFAGHTDVVPTGDAGQWSSAPFAADIRDDRLYGRGAADMKGAIAAFVAAAQRVLARADGVAGSICLLITGDEEGPAVNGTRRLLDWMAANGEAVDVCLVGEPTNPEALGDMIKIGRRGSLNGTLTVTGGQGHVAYPHLADNPIPRLVRMLAALAEAELDDGNDHFQPSNLEITSVDVGNPATNVIPGEAVARFNIRFNDRHDSASLERWLRRTLDRIGGYRLDIQVSGESFLTPPGPLSTLISNAVEQVTGRVPELSTTGGTSDARFIKSICPVVEFGLVGKTMHKVDEQVRLADLHRLTDIYETILARFFDR